MFNKKQEHPLITLQFLLLGDLISSLPPPPQHFYWSMGENSYFLKFNFCTSNLPCTYRLRACSSLIHFVPGLIRLGLFVPHDFTLLHWQKWI